MFKFSSQQSFWNALRRRFMDSDRCFVYFFDGTMPAAFDDIPFDINNLFEVFGQAKLVQTLRVYDNHQHDFGLDNDIAFSMMGTHARLGQPRVFNVDPKWNYWRMEPRHIIPTYWWNPDTLQPNPGVGVENTVTELRSLHMAYRYSNMMRGYEPDEETQISGNFNATTLWNNRSAQTNPYVFEYDQPVTIDAFEYKQWSSTSNNPSFINTIEYWDPTLNSGEGDWVVSQTNYQMYDTMYPRRCLFRIDPMTSTKFRFTFGDTGSSTFVVNHFMLMSSVEPTWGKDPINLTWALIGGFHNAYSGYYQRVYSSSYEEEGYFPYIMCDVGDPTSDAALKLDKATGLDGSFEPLVQNLMFEIKD